MSGKVVRRILLHAPILGSMAVICRTFTLQPVPYRCEKRGSVFAHTAQPSSFSLATTAQNGFARSDTVVHVGNLDWTTSIEQVEAILASVVAAAIPHTDAVPRITVKALPPVDQRKLRDRNKQHGGSATIAFDSSVEASAAILALQKHSESASQPFKLNWASMRSLQPKPSGPPSPPVLTPRDIERRRQRAESYARRRQRVAQRTDELLESIMQAERPIGCVLRASDAVPVLDAPTLDWDAFPVMLDPVRGGGLVPGTERGKRKRAAVEAFWYVLEKALLIEPVEKATTIVADLGCGAGNLALPLAWLLQQKEGDAKQQVLGVDINRNSLERLLKRGNSAELQIQTMYADLTDFLIDPNAGQSAKSLKDMCSIVVSLHACGVASDLAMVAAVSNRLPFAISPCCIGKVKKAWLPNEMPKVVEQHKQGTACISYPRSRWLQKNVRDDDDYELLAAAADYGVLYDAQLVDRFESERRQRCRLAKRVVEIDRLEWAREEGYEVRLLELPRIGSLYPKRELLLGAVAGSEIAQNICRLDKERKVME
jgi:SAM-dependent methyltransferase